MKIEFNLLENARDSLDKAFALIIWSDQQQEASRLKQAVQSVAHAIELLLKERLRRLHPSLIWENVDQYPNLNARTVGAERAAERLKSIGAIEFHNDDLQLLRALRATRNAIEHFAWTTTKPEAEAILGKALEFAFHFARTELLIEYLNYEFHKDGSYQELLISNSEFGNAVSRRKNNSTGSAPVEFFDCPICRAHSVDSVTRSCRLCGHWEPAQPLLKQGGGFDEFDDDAPF